MNEFSHLKNKLLAEQVEDQIYHYILDTPIEPGAKLPNEFELGEKFGVGRSTIREAVKLLSSKGIVEVRRGSGTYVVTTTKGLSDPLGLRSVKDKNQLALDLVNVRLLLEPGIAEMAAAADVIGVQNIESQELACLVAGDAAVALACKKGGAGLRRQAVFLGKCVARGDDFVPDGAQGGQIVLRIGAKGEGVHAAFLPLEKIS